MYDFVIKGATVIDGTGGAPAGGDVAVQDGVIADVGPDVSGPASELILVAKCSTNSGSNCVPAHRRNSAIASSCVQPLR